MKRQEAEARKRLLPSARRGTGDGGNHPSRGERNAGKPARRAVPLPGKPEGATAPAEDDDPEDAVYRSLDWETNPPINGFYEMMMSLTPEKREHAI